MLAAADVVRADDHETELLTGESARPSDRLREAAGRVLAAGPRLLALGAGSAGNLFIWRDRPGAMVTWWCS